MHLIPSGIFYPHVICIMGNGMVIDLPELIKEIKQDPNLQEFLRIK